MRPLSGMQNWGSLPLQAIILLRRMNWVLVGLPLVWTTALLFGIWGLPRFHEQLATQQQHLLRLQKTLSTPATPVPQSPGKERLEQFYAALGDAQHPELPLKTLFAEAAQAGLNLSRAEYKWGDEPAGRYRTYQVVLPVKGSYTSIRQFCEKILQVFPYASLDDLGFKREAIGNLTVETKVRFTFYLSNQPDAAQAPTVAEVAKP